MSSLDSGRPDSAACPIQPQQDPQVGLYSSATSQPLQDEQLSGPAEDNLSQPASEGQLCGYSTPSSQLSSQYSSTDGSHFAQYCGGKSADGQAQGMYSLSGVEEEDSGEMSAGRPTEGHGEGGRHSRWAGCSV